MKEKITTNRSGMITGVVGTTLLSLCLLFSAVSCSDSGLADVSGEKNRPDQSAEKIGFSVDEPESKGLVTDLANLDNIGVYGYYTGIERWDWASRNIAATLVPDYFSNVELKKAQSWTYSPLKYWPVNPIYKLSFFAYSPYVATVDGNGDPEDLTGSAIVPYPALSAETGVPYIGYVVPQAITDQKDLLWASRMDMNINDAPVTFDMKHALASINFTAQFANAIEMSKGYKVDILSITVAGVHGEGKLDLTAGKWSYTDTNTAQYAISGADLSGQTIENNMDIRNCISAASGQLMLLPQILQSEATFVFELKYTDGAVVTETAIAFPVNTLTAEWEAGKAYTYRLQIKGEFITIHTSLFHWDDFNTNTTGDVEL